MSKRPPLAILATLAIALGGCSTTSPQTLDTWTGEWVEPPTSSYSRRPECSPIGDTGPIVPPSDCQTNDQP